MLHTLVSFAQTNPFWAFVAVMAVIVIACFVLGWAMGTTRQAGKLKGIQSDHIFHDPRRPWNG